MFYINLRNGRQHTVDGDITTKKSAAAYAIELFGAYQAREIVNENTGESFSPNDFYSRVPTIGGHEHE